MMNTTTIVRLTLASIISFCFEDPTGPPLEAVEEKLLPTQLFRGTCFDKKWHEEIWKGKAQLFNVAMDFSLFLSLFAHARTLAANLYSLPHSLSIYLSLFLCWPKK
jgi:hypothetical protein